MNGVIDIKAFERLRSTLGRQAVQLLPVLVNDFIKDAPQLISVAEKAAREGRADDLRRAVHALKSNSASFGATALSSLALEIEEAAKEGRCEGAEPRLLRIRDEFAVASAQMKALVEKI